MDQIDQNIAENDARRWNGNKLVNPPCRHLGNGVFENAVLDGRGGYFFPSDRGHLPNASSAWFTVPAPKPVRDHAATKRLVNRQHQADELQRLKALFPYDEDKDLVS